MYRYISHVVSAIEKSDLDQVLSRKRPRSRWGPPFGLAFAPRASLCSSLLTLPGAASAELAPSSWEGCRFRFLIKLSHLFSTFIRINLIYYIPGMYENHGLKSSMHSLRARGQELDSRYAFLFFGGGVHLVYFNLVLRHCGVWFHNRLRVLWLCCSLRYDVRVYHCAFVCTCLFSAAPALCVAILLLVRLCSAPPCRCCCLLHWFRR